MLLWSMILREKAWDTDCLAVETREARAIQTSTFRKGETNRKDTSSWSEIRLRDDSKADGRVNAPICIEETKSSVSRPYVRKEEKRVPRV